MRATFSQFSPKLIFSPPSGKTFNDNSGKRRPLSAPCATLPKGESFYSGVSAPLSPKGKVFPQRGRLLMIIQASGDLSRRFAPLSPKGKAFPPSGKSFNDNFTKREPLSAPCATLPKGESFLFRRFCATLPEGESVSAECEDFLFFRLGF